MATKVLIVEDDLDTRLGLAEMVARRGYVTLAAATFEQARHLLATEKPDVLLVDVRLGAYNGLQLVIEHPDPPATIVMTGYIDPVLESDARRAGAQFLIKPVPPDALLASIDAALQQADAARETKPSRQWRRKPISGGMPARVAAAPAVIRDVSYGGLRLELREVTARLPASFTVTLPKSELDLPVDLVWHSRRNDGAFECGVAVSMMNQSATSAWHDLVDSIA